MISSMYRPVKMPKLPELPDGYKPISVGSYHSVQNRSFATPPHTEEKAGIDPLDLMVYGVMGAVLLE